MQLYRRFAQEVSPDPGLDGVIAPPASSDLSLLTIRKLSEANALLVKKLVLTGQLAECEDLVDRFSGNFGIRTLLGACSELSLTSLTYVVSCLVSEERLALSEAVLDQLEDYITSRYLRFREGDSNSDLPYDRNFWDVVVLTAASLAAREPLHSLAESRRGKAVTHLVDYHDFDLSRPVAESLAWEIIRYEIASGTSAEVLLDSIWESLHQVGYGPDGAMYIDFILSVSSHLVERGIGKLELVEFLESAHEQAVQLCSGEEAGKLTAAIHEARGNYSDSIDSNYCEAEMP